MATVHRQENVDNEKRFRGIIEGLKLVHEKFSLPIIYPIHPRAKKQLKKFGIEVKKVKIVDPLDYLSFLLLESKARLVLTDSGGVQEETCILGVPCVTLRYNTERPETIDVGSNVLAGTEPDEIVKNVDFMLNKNFSWSNPFGNGKAGARIIEIMRNKLG